MKYVQNTAVLSFIDDVANGVIDTNENRERILRLADKTYLDNINAEQLDIVSTEIEWSGDCNRVELPCDVHRLLRVIYNRVVVDWASKGGFLYIPNLPHNSAKKAEIHYYRLPMDNDEFIYPIEMVEMIAYTVIVTLLLPMSFTKPELVAIRSQYEQMKIATYHQYKQSILHLTMTDIELITNYQQTADFKFRQIP